MSIDKSWFKLSKKPKDSKKTIKQFIHNMNFQLKKGFNTKIQFEKKRGINIQFDFYFDHRKFWLQFFVSIKESSKRVIVLSMLIGKQRPNNSVPKFLTYKTEKTFFYTLEFS